MTALVAAVIGAGVGGGLVLVVAGVTGRQVFADSVSRLRIDGMTPAWRRTCLVAAGAVLVFLLTSSVALALLAAAASWVVPRMRGSKAARDEAVARTEAIAAWTEMVRDSMVAAAGLEEAITSTGPIAPAAIGPEVRALVRRLDPRLDIRLPDALRTFGAEVRHPSADLVVAALVIAARMEVRDLAALLSRLAEAIRDDARMRIRVEVGRARIRTAARVIVGVVTATLVLLAVTNLDYLEAYETPAGQVVLIAVGATFGLGARLLDKMASLEEPERFTARTAEAAP
ncbi:MAG TPA: hypothetical protein VIL36_15700 [Acidimicrobiales bacterium]